MPSVDDSADAPDPREPTYVATFDPTAAEQPSEAIVTAVATLADEDPLELPPLYEVVEPNALEALIEHAHRKNAGTHQVWFTYEGFDVGVRTDGRITIVEATGSSASSPA